MAHQIKYQGLGVKKGDATVLASDQTIELKEVDETKMSFLAVASTASEDRDKDILETQGWVLENYLKNPVGLWCHDYHSVPVFKCLRISKDTTQDALIFEPQFADYDFAKMVFNMYVKGFMRAFSVGFIPMKVAPRDANQPWYGGQLYTEQELLEISSVPVPANPEALAEIRGVGLVKDMLPTLLEQGYGANFTKSADNGLYVPVQDPSLFNQARVVNLVKGIKVVSGVPVSDPDAKVTPPVAYMFDPALFDAKSAHDWLMANVPTEQHRKYIDLKPKTSEAKEDQPFVIDVLEVKEATVIPEVKELEDLMIVVEEGTDTMTKFSHNSTLADSEPAWSGVDKGMLPRRAFADMGTTGEKSTWKYPHHFVVGGSTKDDMGCYTDGIMYLHKGGLNAAWSAANGGRSGQEASTEVKSHLEAHRKALGLDDEGKENTEGTKKDAQIDTNMGQGMDMGDQGETETPESENDVIASFLSVTFALLDTNQQPIDGKTLVKVIPLINDDLDIDAMLAGLSGPIAGQMDEKMLGKLDELKHLLVDIKGKTSETKAEGDQSTDEVVLEITEVEPDPKENGDQPIELDPALFASPDKAKDSSQGMVEIDLEAPVVKEVVTGVIGTELKNLFETTLAELGFAPRK